MTDMRNIETIRPSDDAIATEFTPHRQEAIFQEILQTRSTVTPAGSHRRRWLAMGAAAIVGVVVVGLAAQALSPRQGPVVVPTYGGSSATSESPSTQTPSNPPSRNAASAAAMLGVVAATAAAAPAVELGTFVHVTGFSEQTVDSDDPNVVSGYSSRGHDTYIDSDGWMWSHRFGDEEYWLLAQYDFEGLIDTYPTDPEALDVELRSGTGNNSGDERVYKAIHEILITETASPELRSAAILVLKHIAENPQAPETTKDGELASPSMEVTEVPLDTSTEPGYRVSMTDPTSRPGVENWLILDETGQISKAGSVDPDGTFSSSIDSRERVNSLPDEFVEVLGTEQVEKDVDS